MSASNITHSSNIDVVLIGSGVMSSHLGVLLKLLDPQLSIQLFEATEGFAQESSDGWNNAGTGHAGICELSYTPHQNADGTVNIEKALEIFEQFEHSKQFWSHAVKSGILQNPREFINPLAHLSFVHGEKQVAFLKSRFKAMSGHHFFESMEFSEDPRLIEKWAPLLVSGRGSETIAATKMDAGTDVNFGALSRNLLHWLAQQKACVLSTDQRVMDLRKVESGWEVRIKDQKTGQARAIRSKFVFVGAGGGSIALLQKSNIAESQGLGGFPIGGQWLVCTNPKVIAEHHAKVYGQALDAAPTMAVPHLDTRIIDGDKKLLFGPFAAWTTKFLQKKGKWTDLPLSVRPDNLMTLIRIGISNFDLVKYLIQQGTQSMEDRLETLRSFYPAAVKDDWKLIDAGIRVQTIKKTDGEAGIVHYGTEIVTSSDRTLASLMGASPGASVCVNIALSVVRTCFPELLREDARRGSLKDIIPGADVDLKRPENAALFRRLHFDAAANLGLAQQPVAG